MRKSSRIPASPPKVGLSESEEMGKKPETQIETNTPALRLGSPVR